MTTASARNLSPRRPAPADSRAAATGRVSAAPQATRERPALTVVTPPPFRAPRGPFVLTVGAVLTLGLLGVLGINTMVAQDAFALSDLRTRAGALADQEQALTQQVARAESPARLERRARALGMVPSENPVFLRLADGEVLGVPDAPKAPSAVKTKAAAPNDTAPGTTAPTSTDRTVGTDRGTGDQ